MQCEKYTFTPESSTDTLMACFSLFLKGKETRKERTELRKRFMDHLQVLVSTDECFLNPSVRAMVNRLHAINPEKVPKSAEIFYIRDEVRFRQEAATFITQNRREGFVGDMFTFCYLFAELFRVDVHLFQPEEITLSVVAFAKYHMHICYKQGRFHLLLPHLNQPRFEKPLGIIRTSSRVSMPTFRNATVEKSFVPPNILDYRVHHLCIYTKGLHKIETIRKSWEQLLRHDEYAYVFGRVLTADEIKIMSCVSTQGQCGPRFFVDIVPFQLYLIIETNLEDALKAIEIERL